MNQFKDLQNFISNNPVIGCNIEEIIAQKYQHHFFKLISKCFEDNCFSTEVRFKDERSIEVSIQIVFTPITANNEKYIICTIIHNNQNKNHIGILNDYFISPKLRASTTNIFSLLNVMSYAQTKVYNVSKINQLLRDINVQAEKLDHVIEMLYSLLNQKEITNHQK